MGELDNKKIALIFDFFSSLILGIFLLLLLFWALGLTFPTNYWLDKLADLASPLMMLLDRLIPSFIKSVLPDVFDDLYIIPAILQLFLGFLIFFFLKEFGLRISTKMSIKAQYEAYHEAVHKPFKEKEEVKPEYYFDFTKTMKEKKLDESETPPTEQKEAPVISRTATLMFTDIQDIANYTQEFGDKQAHAMIITYNAIMDRIIKQYQGKIIKTVSDAYMIIFSSTQRAVKCAIAIQHEFKIYNFRCTNNKEKVLVRIGINIGEPIIEERDIFGSAVHITSKIMSSAKGGQIYTSVIVKQVAGANKDFKFKRVGNINIKKVEQPVELYEVLWESSSI